MSLFDVTLSNVPIVNLRWEFRDFYERAHSPHFLNHPDGKVRGLQTRYFTWFGMPDAGATMMLSRSISGLEAYICYACEFTGAAKGQLSPRFRVACRNPFALGGGAADNYYNRLPGLIDAGIAMRVSRPELWPRTLAFYNEVRNPVVHGNQLSALGDEQFAKLFDYIADVYDWIDSWHIADDMLEGAMKSFAVRPPQAAT